MQVTNTQVARTLAALGVVHEHEETAEPAPDAETPRRVVEPPPEALELLSSMPDVRRDRTDWARDRLAGKKMPTDDDIADMLIGRLVCDRLR